MKAKGFGGEDIPFVYYHGTTATRAKAIMKSGLDPEKSEYRDEEENDDDYEGPFVFLTEVKKVAKMFAPGGDYSQVKEKGVILRVQPPQEILAKFRFDLGEFVRCPVKIPARYITIEEYTNV